MAKKTNKKKTPVEEKEKDDAALWQEVTRTVAPLPKKAKNIARPDAPKPPTPTPKKKPAAPAPAKATPAPKAKRAAPPSPPPLEHGTVAGIDKRTAQRMKRGTLRPEGRIDLHGMTQDEAHAALNRFIAAAHRAGKRQVLVITGKGMRSGGQGVLRNAVPHWLNGAGLREKIIAFDYANPKDGGEGALYVRLRKPKPETGTGRGKKL